MDYNECKVCADCESKNIKLVKKTHNRFQCFDCGFVNNNFIKQDSIPAYIKPIELNESLRDKYWEGKQQENRLKYQEQFEQKSTENSNDWRSRYDVYLGSPKWKEEVRVARLKMNKLHFGGLCERCFKKPPMQVHHITYPKVFGNEGMFTMEALCLDCHKKLHPHMCEAY